MQFICKKTGGFLSIVKEVNTLLWKEVDLSRLARNVEIIKKQVGDKAKILFVAKVDGYGHGLIEVSQVAQKASLDYLAVANLKEAEKLRKEAINIPILVFGPIPPEKESIEDIVNFDITPTITNTNTNFLRALNHKSKSQEVITPIHLNLDTGMGRTGLLLNGLISFVKKVREFHHLQLEGVYSHLSVADSERSRDKRYTLRQISKFREVLHKLKDHDLLPPLRHIGNSAGLIQYQDEVTEPPFNMVRIGTLFYGYPETDREWVYELEPVISVFTRVAEIRKLPPKSYIGYGRNYKTESEKSIAVLSVGYGEGLNRKISGSGKVAINNHKVPIVGEVCANHTMVDVSEIDHVKVGDRVELMGNNIPVNQLSQQTGAGILELLSPFAKKRT